MSDAAKLDSSMRDFLTEAEAAAYCCTSVRNFQRRRDEYGIRPVPRFGRNLYARADLYQAMNPVAPWQASQSNGGTNDPTYHGSRLGVVGVGPLGNLAPRPLRKSAARSKRS